MLANSALVRLQGLRPWARASTYPPLATPLGIDINPAKSEFGKSEIVFLGHLVCCDGVKPTKDKVDAVVQFPQSSTAKQLCRYLGMVPYYHRFFSPCC